MCRPIEQWSSMLLMQTSALNVTQRDGLLGAAGVGADGSYAVADHLLEQQRRRPPYSTVQVLPSIRYARSLLLRCRISGLQRKRQAQKMLCLLWRVCCVVAVELSFAP